MSAGNGKWMTIKEVSEISGKSINALRLLIHRGKIDNLKKVKGKGHGEWLIHKDILQKFQQREISENLTSQEISEEKTTQKSQEISNQGIPLDYFDKKLKEWDSERDNLIQGLIMYRYKFEELDKKLKFLPAPPEEVVHMIDANASKVKELEILLQQEKMIRNDLEKEIETQKNLSWWKKLFSVRK